MANRTGNSSVNSSIRQNNVKTEAGISNLLTTQKAALGELLSIKKLLIADVALEFGELSSIKKLLKSSKDIKNAEKSAAVGALASAVNSRGSAGNSRDSGGSAHILAIAKEQLMGSRRYWKSQEEFQDEWDKEAKNIAEMAKGMKVFKTLGDKMADKKEGLKEKFGVSNGGLKKTMLNALNVGGVFNKTLARDEFVKKQQALGSKESVKQLKSDFSQAQKATKAIQKNESKIDALKKLTGADEITLKDHHSKLFDERQSQTEKLSTYDRSARKFSPDIQNAALARNAMSNMVPLPTTPELGKTPTATAAESTQGAEVAAENMKMTQLELDLLQTIAENTGGAKTGAVKKPEEAKASGGGLMDTIMSFLSNGLMTAFKSLLNPMSILKALGKVFAIGMIIGAVFEGVMDGFNEFMKTGDIGKALIAGLAGIIDFLTFGLFDKDKIKEVIGDFATWTNTHLIKPFVNFISGIKDSFMSMLEGIGIPEITIFKNPITDKEYKVGPFYPFKSDAKPTAAAPTAAAPTTANQVESKSAENAGAKETPAPSNKTNVVNAPVTTNNTTTQVQMRPPIRNVESSQSRYAESRYA